MFQIIEIFKLVLLLLLLCLLIWGYHEKCCFLKH